MSEDGRDDAGATDGVADDGGIDAGYEERDGERRIVYAPPAGDGPTVTVAAPTGGYGMLIVRRDGAEVERYYGLDMALDHAAELLGVPTGVLPVPGAAADMGM